MTEEADIIEATKQRCPEQVLGNSRKGPLLVDSSTASADLALRRRRLVPGYRGRSLPVTGDAEREKQPTSERGGGRTPYYNPGAREMRA
jgi:hypothetical protein